MWSGESQQSWQRQSHSKSLTIPNSNESRVSITESMNHMSISGVGRLPAPSFVLPCSLSVLLSTSQSFPSRGCGDFYPFPTTSEFPTHFSSPPVHHTLSTKNACDNCPPQLSAYLLMRDFCSDPGLSRDHWFENKMEDKNKNFYLTDNSFLVHQIPRQRNIDKRTNLQH